MFIQPDPFINNELLDVINTTTPIELRLPFKRTIAFYPMRSGLNFFPWLLYRIFNAVKAIFGQSDWQITRNLISTNYNCKTVEKKLKKADQALNVLIADNLRVLSE